MFKFKIKKRVGILGIAFLGFCGISTQWSDDFEIAKNIEIFSNIYRELNTYFVDEIDPEEFMNKGAISMLKHLDKYTTYIPKKEVAQFNSSISGRYGGVGAGVIKIDDYLWIRSLTAGAPAQKAGLVVGDKILEVNGAGMKGKSVKNLVDLTRGTVGTDLSITVERIGTKKQEVIAITRGEVRVPNVLLAKKMDNGMAYVKLTTFSSNATLNIKNALTKLGVTEENSKGIILDLRDNSGGLLTEAVSLVNLFVPKHTPVVTLKGRTQRFYQRYKTLNEVMYPTLPLIVLVNNSSASASEIVAGALQDLDRAVLLGDTTYGKGVVQSIRELKHKAKIKLTSARYLLPSGRCIQKLALSTGKPTARVQAASFTTKAGRIVMGDEGVAPDLLLTTSFDNRFVRSLLRKGILHKFLFKLMEERPAGVPNFSGVLFEEFCTFAKSSTAKTKTNFEASIDALTEELKDELYKNDYTVLSEELITLKKGIFEEDLRKHKKGFVQVMRYIWKQSSEGKVAAQEDLLEQDAKLGEWLTKLADTSFYKKQLIK
jgi:carboxyl-terminal processing protease